VDFGIPEDKLSLAAKALRDGMVIYARAMGALEQEDVDGGARASDQLDALLWRLMRDRTDQADKTDEKSQALNSTAQRVEKILGVASKELAGNVASHRGNYERAKELLEQAVEAEKKLGYSEPPTYSRPALESLGYAAIRAGKWDARRIPPSASRAAKIRIWLLRHRASVREGGQPERGFKSICGVLGFVEVRR
jgi:hypothetical protein